MRQSLAALALAAALAACSAPPQAVAPTATPAPIATPASTATPAPTATPRPTATPAPTATPSPAATSQESGDSASAQAITDALGRTAAVASYSAEVELAGSGFAGAPAGAAAELLTLRGRFAGAEHEFTATGLLAAFLGADPGTGLQAVRAGGESYIKGPMALIGAVDPVWYRLPPERAALAEPPISPTTIGRLLSQVELGDADFTAGEPVSRDGQECTPYLGETAATVALLGALAQGGLPPIVAPEQVQRGESALLICADGYLHELTMELAGEFPGSAPAPFSLSLAARLAEIEEPISITPPAGARALPAPAQPTP